MTEQLLVRLPEELVRRFKRAVAPRRRSKFIEQLLEQALPLEETGDSDPLYQAALAVEGTKPWRRRWPSGKERPLATA